MEIEDIALFTVLSASRYNNLLTHSVFCHSLWVNCEWKLAQAANNSWKVMNGNDKTIKTAK